MRNRPSLPLLNALPLLAGLLLLILGVGCSSTPRPTVDPSSGPLAGSDELPPEVVAAPVGQRVDRGVASWYGPGFQGNRTANGEIYDMEAMTAAHKTLPFDTWVEVVNRDNGRRTRLRINDRGPFIRGRVIDLSKAGARVLGVLGPGTARVELYLVAPYPPGYSTAGENSSETPATNTTPGLRGAYTVQLGAFTDQERARALRRRLIRRHPATVVERGADGLYRVRIGAFPRRADAEELLRELQGNGYDAALVRLQPTGL